MPTSGGVDFNILLVTGRRVLGDYCRIRLIYDLPSKAEPFESICLLRCLERVVQDVERLPWTQEQ